MDTYAKLLGALLLLLSVAFPMSTCSHYEDAGGKRLTLGAGENPPEDATEVVQYNYAFEGFQPLDPREWVRAFGFAWPILAVAIQKLRKRGAVVLVVRILEPPLIVGSVLLVEFLATFFADRRAVGAYLAFLALGVYAMAAIWADVAAYRNWRRQRA